MLIKICEFTHNILKLIFFKGDQITKMADSGDSDSDLDTNAHKPRKLNVSFI